MLTTQTQPGRFHGAQPAKQVWRPTELDEAKSADARNDAKMVVIDTGLCPPVDNRWSDATSEISPKYSVDYSTGDCPGELRSGTHVAATIAGVSSASEIKVAEGARFLSPSREISVDDIKASIAYSQPNGARIVNNSWGGGGDHAPLAQVFAKTADSLGHQVGPEGFILAK